MQPRSQSSPLAPAVMVHYYRGIMDLSVTWRARIDSTTNWAIVTAGSMASFLLSGAERPHVMALLGMFLMFAFLVIEARRYRFYDLWSGWIRLMESDYFGPILQRNTIEPSAQWHTILSADLENPHFKISWSEAMGRRLRHNYFAIFLFILLLWLLKLAPGASVAGECETVAQCANIGPVPGIIVILLVGCFYAYLIGLVLFTHKLRGTGTELLDRRLIFRRMVAPDARLVGFKQHRARTYIVDSAARPPEED
jgi:uncharacterized membrane protein